MAKLCGLTAYISGIKKHKLLKLRAFVVSPGVEQIACKRLHTLPFMWKGPAPTKIRKKSEFQELGRVWWSLGVNLSGILAWGWYMF